MSARFLNPPLFSGVTGNTDAGNTGVTGGVTRNTPCVTPVSPRQYPSNPECVSPAGPRLQCTKTLYYRPPCNPLYLHIPCNPHCNPCITSSVTPVTPVLTGNNPCNTLSESRTTRKLSRESCQNEFLTFFLLFLLLFHCN